MSTKVNPIPAGYEGATPYLCCKDASSAIEFYKRAFGATELYRIPMPGGTLGHAEIKIGGAIIMLSDEFPDHGSVSPQRLGGTPVHTMIYVPDVDGFAALAIAAGAKVLEPVKDQFYGDRNCKLSDPFGHVWMFATHTEDVPPQEIATRAAKMFGGQAA